ncbi:MAG: hypothetical protein AB7I41_15765 [Candidatus Sericytochromatia bacterium]
MVSPVNIFIGLKIALTELETQTRAFLAVLPTDMATQAAFHYTSPQALALPEELPGNTPEWVTLRSAQPVLCASGQGQRAQIQGEKLSKLLPNTRYAFPLLHFELTDPEGQRQSVEVLIPPFQTFAEGVLERHLLEFAVTLLDLDLQPFGFRALRNDVQLVIQASPEAAGWNLALKDLLLLPLPPQTQTCYLGLKPGLSSTEPGQTRGLSPATAWGKYSLNGVELTLLQSHPPQPDLQRVRAALVAQCNAALASSSITAWIDPEGHLLFKAQHPGQTLELRHLPDPLWPLGAQLQALDLPEGKVAAVELQLPTPVEKLALGSLRLNGQTFDWGIISQHRPGQVRAELADRFAAVKAQTGLSLWLDATGFLHLSGPEIELVPLGPSPWGLEAIHFKVQSPDWASLKQQFEVWIQAANQGLRQIHKNPPLKPLELPLRQALLAQMPGQMGVQVSLAPETGLQLNARPEVLIAHFETIADALKRYLGQLPTHVQALMAHLAELEKAPQTPVSQPLVSPVAPTPTQAPVFAQKPQADQAPAIRPTPLLSEEVEEPPQASFDHKI